MLNVHLEKTKINSQYPCVDGRVGTNTKPAGELCRRINERVGMNRLKADSLFLHFLRFHRVGEHTYIFRIRKR
jgi:hypothetical protein